MDIGAWLRSLGLERYEAAFCKNAIEADVLCYLTDQDLEKLGVLLGDRRRLLRATMDDDPTPLVVGQDESRNRSGAYCHPKLSAMAVIDPENFAASLERAISRSSVRLIRDRTNDAKRGCGDCSHLQDWVRDPEFRDG